MPLSSSSDSTYLIPPHAAADRGATTLKNFGTPVNAIAFGFIATAILIAMFLIMGIFEHLLKPRILPSHYEAEGSPQSNPSQDQVHILEKLRNLYNVSALHSTNFSVVMPGQDCATFIAQPAPLPCSRESIHWPLRTRDFVSISV
ncbi:hypothetical protein IFM89_020234 [Coptis chinensis]|uniref:Uncharacterized protein n=1 Tax=Coptis chinensis TaxID=261450 RepID=A0A835HNH0_9MAGN|nr:hypothetical protein IFM89_020234 [Coptis chinensis]